MATGLEEACRAAAAVWLASWRRTQVEIAVQTMRQGQVTPEGLQRSLVYPLAGRHILVIEDEALVALDLEMTLQAAGAVTVGPFLRLRDALPAVATATADAAVLDVMLGRDKSFALADRLRERGVAVVFHTGHSNSECLRARYPGAGHCPKPCTPATIIRTIVEAIGA